MMEMIRFNYTQVENDFQSIYNIHEVVLSMALPLIAEIRDKTLSLDQLMPLMEPRDSEEPEPIHGFFPDFDESVLHSITKLNQSFLHYAW